MTRKHSALSLNETSMLERKSSRVDLGCNPPVYIWNKIRYATHIAASPPTSELIVSTQVEAKDTWPCLREVCGIAKNSQIAKKPYHVMHGRHALDLESSMEGRLTHA
jgi:hypothetical protein